MVRLIGYPKKSININLVNIHYFLIILSTFVLSSLFFSIIIEGNNFLLLYWVPSSILFNQLIQICLIMDSIV